MRKGVSWLWVCISLFLMGGVYQGTLQAQTTKVLQSGQIKKQGSDQGRKEKSSSRTSTSLPASNSVRDKKEKSTPEKAGNLPARWVKGPSPMWHVSMDTALKAARKENRNLFVLSTGSNWCGFCIKLHKEVLDKPEFEKYAKKNLVLVYLDVPNGKVMPDSQLLYNKEVQKALRFPGGVPAVLILDKEGRTLGNIVGYKPMDDYLKRLDEILKKKDQEDKGPLPPEWLKKPPSQLTSMLDDLQAKKEEAIKKAAEASEAAKSQIQFKIVAWGLDKDKIQTPFNPKKTIDVPVGTDVFFKVQYHTPKTMRAIAYLRMPSVSRSSYGQFISGDGEFVSSLAYTRPCRQDTLQISVRLSMEEAQSFQAATFPCSVSWK